MSFFKKLFGAQSSDKAESLPISKEKVTNASDATSDIEDNKEALRQADVLKFDAIRAIKIGEVKFAVNALRKSFELAPRFETLYYLSEALLMDGEEEEGLQAMNMLLEDQPNHTLTLIRKSTLLLQIGDIEEALGDADKALKTTSEPDEQMIALLLKARALYALRRAEEAVDILNKALRVEGENPYTALLLRAEYLNSIDRLEEAKSDLEQIKNINEEEEKVPLMLADIATKQEDMQRALDFYYTALELNPFNLEAHRGIARTLIAMGKNAEAEEYIDNAIEENPEDYHLLKIAIDFYHKIDRDDKAEKLSEKAEKLSPENGTSESVGKNLYQGGIY